MTAVALGTEDALSEALGKRLLGQWPILSSQPPLLLRKNGFGYLKSKMDSWRALAEHQIVLILTDLDHCPCPIALLNDWKGRRGDLPINLILRIAVCEAEAWLLADHEAMRSLLGNKGKLPEAPDELMDPKQYLLQLAKRAPRSIKEDLVQEKGSVASQGIGYNQRLVAWVENTWSPQRAAERSPSLRKACFRLEELSMRLTNL